MTFLEDIKSYLGFGDDDAATLEELHPVLSPHFETIAAQFYDRVLSHAGTAKVFESAGVPVERLRTTLVAWMDSGLVGPHDESFFDQRARVGQAHVSIGLPQQYMVTAMHVLRTAYRHVLTRVYADDRERFDRASAAVERLFGVELAIMLHSYRVDSEQRLRQRERMAALGQVAASIGHDLRNPLAVIDSSTFVLRRRYADHEKIVRHVDRIAAQVAVCERIVSNVLELAANRPLKAERIDVRAAFDEAVASVAVPHGVVIRYEVADGVSLHADKNLVARAVANLITNSANAIGPGGGTVELRADLHDDDVAVTVTDDGPGFDPVLFPTLFESNASTSRGNTGLGLPLVKSVVERHGGRVTAENEADGGARVTMLFPATTPPGGSSHDEPESPPRTRAPATYLH